MHAAGFGGEYDRLAHAAVSVKKSSAVCKIAMPTSSVEIWWKRNVALASARTSKRERLPRCKYQRYTVSINAAGPSMERLRLSAAAYHAIGLILLEDSPSDARSQISTFSKAKRSLCVTDARHQVARIGEFIHHHHRVCHSMDDMPHHRRSDKASAPPVTRMRFISARLLVSTA